MEVLTTSGDGRKQTPLVVISVRDISGLTVAERKSPCYPLPRHVIPITFLFGLCGIRRRRRRRIDNRLNIWKIVRRFFSCLCLLSFLFCKRMPKWICKNFYLLKKTKWGLSRIPLQLLEDALCQYLFYISGMMIHSKKRCFIHFAKFA